MKTSYSHVARPSWLGMFLSALLFAPSATAGDSQEFRITSSSNSEQSPVLGRDSSGDLVVYRSTPFPPYQIATFNDPGLIFFQRLRSGSALSAPVQVSDGLTDDRSFDVSGSKIVYTAFADVFANRGRIKVYDTLTGTRNVLPGSAAIVRDVRIHGSVVVWIEERPQPGSRAVMYFDLNCPLVNPAQVFLGVGFAGIGGLRDLQIGDRFVVWAEVVNEFWNIFALDLTNATIVTVTTGSPHDRFPATSGDWVVWKQDYSGIESLQAKNLVTGVVKDVVNDGSHVSAPSIDGDGVAYSSDFTGDYEVYSYRLSTEFTCRVTGHPDDQTGSNVFGDLVAYVDARHGNPDVYVAKLLPDIEVSSLFMVFVFLQPPSQTLTLSNVGCADLVIGDIAFLGGGVGAFSISSLPALPVVIPPGGSVDVEVTVSACDAQSVLRIGPTNDPDEPSVEVTIWSICVQ